MFRIFSPKNLMFALLVMCMAMAIATPSIAQIRISVGFGPPPLPVYEQPLCPGDGYLWTPGYWAWDGDFDDYYWVPGTWVLAPEIGFLWTPPYWGWDNGAYLFYDGYWGPTIGFYGGIDYGFGYFGTGFYGGRWEGGHFFYNRGVMNVNATEIHNVYNERVEHNVYNHVAYNGGPGGISARATPQEEAAAHERHIGRVAAQNQQIDAARGNPELRASANHGKPPVAATPRAGEFKGKGVVTAKEAGGEYHPPANRGAAAGGEHAMSGGPVHPKDLPPIERVHPNTGNAKADQKYQQQQEKLAAKQESERQKLQQKQDKEHQQLAKQNADASRNQQVEQRHQQQTQQMQQRHTQQQQNLQQKYSPPPARGGGRK
ncbi:MAG: YXWGXW repeat-containing protein [Terriglobales bacterium]|jgi:hypothetical protein